MRRWSMVGSMSLISFTMHGLSASSCSRSSKASIIFVLKDVWASIWAHADSAFLYNAINLTSILVFVFIISRRYYDLFVLTNHCLTWIWALTTRIIYRLFMKTTSKKHQLNTRVLRFGNYLAVTGSRNTQDLHYQVYFNSVLVAGHPAFNFIPITLSR